MASVTVHIIIKSAGGASRTVGTFAADRDTWEAASEGERAAIVKEAALGQITIGDAMSGAELLYTVEQGGKS